MMAYKAVAFDYDGTLFDTRPAIVHSLRAVFEASHRPIPALDAISATVARGIGLHDTFALLDDGLRNDRAALESYVKLYRAIYLDEGTPMLKPFAGTHEVLRHIHGAGIKCFVVSNKGIAAIRRSLDRSGLMPFVDLVLAEAAGVPQKPDPALVTDYMLPHYAGLQSRDILMVGDTETDIAFAKASGMVSCWASYGYGTAETCRALAPQHEIADITDLLTLVAGSGA